MSKNLRAFLDGASDFDRHRALENGRTMSEEERSSYRRGYLQAAKWSTNGWKKILVKKSLDK